MAENILIWIQEWYSKNCDGLWEHSYGVEINTLDNPGWSVKIDLAETEWENISIEYKLTDNGEDDWYAYSVKDKLFSGAGDCNKLEKLLNIFRGVVEGRSDLL